MAATYKDAGDLVRVIAFPRNGSAYTHAFYDALKDKVEIVSGDWSGRWLWYNLRRDDVVHVHWPSFYYHVDGVLAVSWRFLRFALLFLLIKLRARAVFWTAHNLLPHKRCIIPILDVWGRVLMIRLANRIFIHGETEAEKTFTERFPSAAEKIVTIPHGNWLGYYSEAPAKHIARQRLSLPQDAFVFELFGYCQPYKNIHGLVQAFIRIAGADDYLLIAGQFSNDAYRADIERLAAGHPNIRIDSQFIPSASVPVYVAACDLICVPYQEILTSGTAMLALSYGRPVLSVDGGFLRDVIPPSVGILITPGVEKALVDGMLRAKQTVWSEERIRHHAKSFDFAQAAEILFAQLSLLDTAQVGLKDA